MKHRLFALEHLEGRSLFSVVGPVDAMPVMATTAAPATTQAKAVRSPFLGVAFNVAGKFTHPIGPIGNADAGSTYQFRGTGNTKALGAFTLKGYVTAPGFVANGRSTGKFIITTAHGSITLSVIGPPQDPGVLPASLSFTIVKGNGAYLHSSGKGTIGVSASATTHKFLFRFKPTN